MALLTFLVSIQMLLQQSSLPWVWSLHQEDLLEKEMATHSSILTWEIPRTEEFGVAKSRT